MGRMLMVVAALAICGAVAAQEGGKGKEGSTPRNAAPAASLTFAQIDANADGQISKVEWLAFFAKLDVNKDGVITADEAAGSASTGGGDGAKKKGGEGERKSGKGDGK